MQSREDWVTQVQALVQALVAFTSHSKPQPQRGGPIPAQGGANASSASFGATLGSNQPPLSKKPQRGGPIPAQPQRGGPIPAQGG
ncbi:MAG: hypothetical protein JW829_19295, partial [Pirellulales bacterium]|nr:hypothetical protein [Pirellulales bacterium]